MSLHNSLSFVAFRVLATFALMKTLCHSICYLFSLFASATVSIYYFRCNQLFHYFSSHHISKERKKRKKAVCFLNSFTRDFVGFTDFRTVMFSFLFVYAMLSIQFQSFLLLFNHFEIAHASHLNIRMRSIHL